MFFFVPGGAPPDPPLQAWLAGIGRCKGVRHFEVYQVWDPSVKSARLHEFAASRLHRSRRGIEQRERAERTGKHCSKLCGCQR